MNKTSIKEIVNLIKEDTLKGLKGFTVKYANGLVETYENRLYTFVMDEKKSYPTDCKKLEKLVKLKVIVKIVNILLTVKNIFIYNLHH